MNFIQQIARLLCEHTLEDFLNMPPPPQSMGIITCNEMRSILRDAFPTGSIFMGDWDYELTSVEENQRFLKWYEDTTQYKVDEYDCEVFAWLQRAFALKWMKGKFPWYHITGEGTDAKYRFPPHGFNGILDHEKKIYICDELCVAAPRDQLIPVYSIKAYKVET